MMPAWMRFVWREDPSRFLAFADLVFGIEPVDETEEAVADAVTAAIDELQAFFAELGMPTKLGEFGLKLENVDAFLVQEDHLGRRACYLRIGFLASVYDQNF